MNTKQHVVASILLILLDILWIQFVMKKRYLSMIHNIQGSNDVNIWYGILAYTFALIGLNLFVLPNIKKDKLKDSLKYGFVFGLVVYGVFDFTNAALISKWDIKLAMIDVLWGGFLYFIVSYISSFVN